MYCVNLKLTVASILAFLIIAPVSAQRRIIILGPQLAVAYNSLSSVASSGPGVSMKYDRFVSSHLAFTFSLDYINFTRASGNVNPGVKLVEPSSKLITLSEQLGCKYYPWKKSDHKGFYLSAEAGILTSWLKYYDAGKLYSSIDQTNFSYRYGFGLSSRHFDYGILWQNFYQQNNEISLVYGTGIQNNPLKYFCIRVSYIFPD